MGFFTSPLDPPPCLNIAPLGLQKSVLDTLTLLYDAQSRVKEVLYFCTRLYRVRALGLKQTSDGALGLSA